MFRSASVSFILALALLVAGCVAIPTKNEPAGYTQALVQDAIRLYGQDGREAAIDHYSSTENVDGQWYVFIIGGDGYTIAPLQPRHDRARPPRCASTLPAISMATTF